jgi:hypothetical protein
MIRFGGTRDTWFRATGYAEFPLPSFVEDFQKDAVECRRLDRNSEEWRQLLT